MAETSPSTRNQDIPTLLTAIVDATRRISLDDAAAKLRMDKKDLFRIASQLQRESKIKIEAHFLQDPDLISLKQPAADAGKPRITPQEEIDLEEKEHKKNLLADQLPEGKYTEVDAYIINAGDMHLPVRIIDTGDYVYHYHVTMPHIDFVTRALLDETKRALVGEIRIEGHDILDTEKFAKLKAKFLARSKEKLRSVLKRASNEYIATLSRVLVNEMIGLGDIEYLLADANIEEVVVNSAKDVVWVYHKKHAWVKTNIYIPTEDMIMNYASRIAREVGREITNLAPLLDAHLITGDRINATLYPISTIGNTVTIRRFSRTPWTVIHFMDPDVRTVNTEAAAFLWLAIEYELSMLIAGGTASGKTTMLNALMPFMPANQRIISIEDTRELNLPGYLHWIPLTVRPPNPQGEGEVSMLDLMQNSLRMRPDRIIVGEVRRKEETEVLFEAMHTGHSVYGTFHAEQASEVVDRITSPPMSIPGSVLRSLHLIVVQYRNRRTRQRRTFEVVEITRDETDIPQLNTLYKWQPRTDTIEKMYPSVRVKDELELFAGLNEAEIAEDLAGKQKILNWLQSQNIRGVENVGRIVTEYYLDKETVLELISEGRNPVT
ncbi:Type II/IV secretion system protein [uncultured archaeon]|nr:Type II/IV secretion system protein [uncultured archaeon]